MSGTDITKVIPSEAFTTADGVTVAYSDDSRGGLSERDLAKLDKEVRQVAFQLSNWVNQARAAADASTLFQRGKYTTDDNPLHQMRVARAAMADDDVVSNIAEVTEGMAFQGIKWESSNPDETDVFNQIAIQQDLDSVVRKIWREEFATGTCVLAMWWEKGNFTVRGKTTDTGTRRRQKYPVYYPSRITVLDPTRVIPVGMGAFGQERLAWIATAEEMDVYQQVCDPNSGYVDEVMTRFYSGKYVPADANELIELGKLGIDPTRLILLDDRYVSRHTLTRADFDRFADVRIKSIFRLLDLKQQLMEMDRVHLIGAANYILLVKKGSKEDPAYPEEIDNLRDNFNYIAKLPVIFSDHRLEIEIITPKTDVTLDADKYDVIDSHIASRMLNTLSPTSSRSGNRADTSLSEGRSVARSLENRRHQIRRYLEREIARRIFEAPENKDVFKDEQPSLTFEPRRLQLDDDTGTAQAIIAMRQSRELSRESLLEYFGFDQSVEAMRMEYEEKAMDDIFKTVTPFSGPDGQPPSAQGSNGSKGGRPTGGGKPSANPAKAPARTSRGTTKPSGGAK